MRELVRDAPSGFGRFMNLNPSPPPPSPKKKKKVSLRGAGVDKKEVEGWGGTPLPKNCQSQGGRR